MTTFRNPPTVHVPLGGYSHQAEIGASARWLVVSGQVGKTLHDEIPEDPLAQIELALENVRRNLEAAGMAITDIVRLTWYFVGEIDAARRQKAIAEWLSGHEPCSTVLYVAALARPVYRVEVDAWACRT